MVEVRCRLCASSGCQNGMLDIFQPTETNHLIILKIYQILQINIRKNDPLPNTVCISCIGKLNIAYNFVNGCLQAQIILKKHLLKDANKIIKNNCMELEKMSQIFMEQLESPLAPVYNHHEVNMLPMYEYQNMNIRQKSVACNSSNNLVPVIKNNNNTESLKSDNTHNMPTSQNDADKIIRSDTIIQNTVIPRGVSTKPICSIFNVYSTPTHNFENVISDNAQINDKEIQNAKCVNKNVNFDGLDRWNDCTIVFDKCQISRDNNRIVRNMAEYAPLDNAVISEDVTNVDDGSDIKIIDNNSDVEIIDNDSDTNDTDDLISTNIITNINDTNIACNSHKNIVNASKNIAINYKEPTSENYPIGEISFSKNTENPSSSLILPGIGIRGKFKGISLTRIDNKIDDKKKCSNIGDKINKLKKNVCKLSRAKNTYLEPLLVNTEDTFGHASQNSTQIYEEFEENSGQSGNVMGNSNDNLHFDHVNSSIHFIDVQQKHISSSTSEEINQINKNNVDIVVHGVTDVQNYMLHQCPLCSYTSQAIDLLRVHVQNVHTSSTSELPDTSDSIISTKNVKKIANIDAVNNSVCDQLDEFNTTTIFKNVSNNKGMSDASKLRCRNTITDKNIAMEFSDDTNNDGNNIDKEHANENGNIEADCVDKNVNLNCVHTQLKDIDIEYTNDNMSGCQSVVCAVRNDKCANNGNNIDLNCVKHIDLGYVNNDNNVMRTNDKYPNNGNNIDADYVKHIDLECVNNVTACKYTNINDNISADCVKTIDLGYVNNDNNAASCTNNSNNIEADCVKHIDLQCINNNNNNFTACTNDKYTNNNDNIAADCVKNIGLEYVNNDNNSALCANNGNKINADCVKHIDLGYINNDNNATSCTNNSNNIKADYVKHVDLEFVKHVDLECVKHVDLECVNNNKNVTTCTNDKYTNNNDNIAADCVKNIGLEYVNNDNNSTSCTNNGNKINADCVKHIDFEYGNNDNVALSTNDEYTNNNDNIAADCVKNIGLEYVNNDNNADSCTNNGNKIDADRVKHIDLQYVNNDNVASCTNDEYSNNNDNVAADCVKNIYLEYVNNVERINDKYTNNGNNIDADHVKNIDLEYVNNDNNVTTSINNKYTNNDNNIAADCVKNIDLGYVNKDNNVAARTNNSNNIDADSAKHVDLEYNNSDNNVECTITRSNINTEHVKDHNVSVVYDTNIHHKTNEIIDKLDECMIVDKNIVSEHITKNDAIHCEKEIEVAHNTCSKEVESISKKLCEHKYSDSKCDSETLECRIVNIPKNNDVDEVCSATDISIAHNIDIHDDICNDISVPEIVSKEPNFTKSVSNKINVIKTVNNDPNISSIILPNNVTARFNIINNTLHFNNAYGVNNEDRDVVERIVSNIENKSLDVIDKDSANKNGTVYASQSLNVNYKYHDKLIDTSNTTNDVLNCTADVSCRHPDITPELHSSTDTVIESLFQPTEQENPYAINCITRHTT